MLVTAAIGISSVGFIVKHYALGAPMDEAVRSGAYAAAIILGTLVASGAGADGCCCFRRRG